MLCSVDIPGRPAVVCLFGNEEGIDLGWVEAKTPGGVGGGETVVVIYERIKMNKNE